MLVSGVKMFNTAFLAKNKAMSVPFRGALTNEADTFVRTTKQESEDKMVDSLQPNEKRFLGEDAKYLDDAKEILDTHTFKFSSNGEVFEGTLREYFEDAKGRESTLSSGYTLYHATTKECINSIMKNGLDYTQTCRMKCGPGTYFAPAMGAAMDFGSAFVEASCKGDVRYAGFKSCFYDAVSENPAILNTLSKELGISTLTASGLLKVISHNILTKDMGIDILYAGSGYSTGSYVVLNKDCVRLSRV